jgi:hypothetical protein
MSLNLFMQKAGSLNELRTRRWDLGIVGAQLDDRGRAATDFVASQASRVVNLQYDPSTFELVLDGRPWAAEEADRMLSGSGGQSLLLESTTLGFVEVFLMLRAAADVSARGISMLYVEPGSYDKPEPRKILEKRYFGLSVEGQRFSGVPTAASMLSDRRKQKVVFLLGYEEHRLARAFENHPMIHPGNCSVVLGVPAYQAGWEMNAFANNIRVLRDRNVRGGVHFCGAENPEGALEVLRTIHRELEPDETMFVAPIGTKPNGIGAALFAASNQDIGLLYDHPKRKKGRSDGVGGCHLFDVEFVP